MAAECMVQAIFDWVDWVGISTILVLIIVLGLLWVCLRDRNGNDTGDHNRT